MTVRMLMLAFTAGIFAFSVRTQIAHWTVQTWWALGALLLLFAILLELGVPFLAFRHFGQREGDPGKINFDLPLYTLSFALFGWFATAVLSFCANLLTPGATRRYMFTERLLVASTRVPFFFVAGALRAAFGASVLQFSVNGFCAFFAMSFLWIAAFILCWFDVLTSLRAGTSLRKIWRAHLSDPTLWSIFGAQIVWGFASAQIYLRAGAVLGVASVLPLVLLAAVLRSLHAQRLAVHRLTFARDAVQALLGARDPLPHINAILASVHSELLKETLQILMHGGTGSDVWQTVTSIGPPPDDAAIQVRRHAMHALIETERSISTSSSQDHSVFAFAARDESGRLLGVLAVHRPAGAGQPIHRRQFETAAAALGPLLHDFSSIKKTQTAACIDPLTGLANRSTILDTLRRSLKRVDLGASCSILILDIDHFKTVNDRLGHQAGDRCLQLIGFVIASNVRSVDRAGRIGGEEFLVLMPDADRNVALVIGERLRQAIERSGFNYADGKPVTASLGVASAALGDTIETFVERADRALYEAKRGGRNRVIATPV
ncbi:MAG: GGDEF domain-containing protein [Candidatus Eremiobacteraeota bacterium]|nr:GGDEF domain-containing protein [Candidatus Eremiobacteraeota bacterium]